MGGRSVREAISDQRRNRGTPPWTFTPRGNLRPFFPIFLLLPTLSRWCPYSLHERHALLVMRVRLLPVTDEELGDNREKNAAGEDIHTFAGTAMSDFGEEGGCARSSDFPLRSLYLVLYEWISLVFHHIFSKYCVSALFKKEWLAWGGRKMVYVI